MQGLRGATTVGGYIGVSPGTAITGETSFSYTTEPTPNGRASIAIAATAKADLTTASLDAAGRDENVTMITVLNIGGLTFTPGLYKASVSLEVSSGTLYLSGNGVFIFQMASTLLVSTGMKMVLLNGALASNIFWSVGSAATFMVGSEVVGTVMAQSSISVLTGATITGRLFALNGAVTLQANVIAFPSPACLSTEYEDIREPPSYDRICMDDDVDGELPIEG
eukprot:gene621-biopygen357